ncbi:MULTISPECIES: hypothetical protein [Sphingobacterium]|uniref:Uncharacterized protein n=1 Tax=Sphingobacterium populi TaxID=1812824 RepID=A0ABW5U9C4_9SPHI|nr:hypothetical protein [Sphingobacterium sp. CFCC 11742]
MAKLFELHQGDNIGGIAKVQIAHITDFKSFNPVSFHPNKGWQEIAFIPSSGTMKGEEKDSDNGVYHHYEGLFEIQYQSNVVSFKLRTYIGKVSVLKITDLNGRSRVIGTPEEPVTVSRSSDTGSAPKDMNHNVVTFSVDQLLPALL